MMAWRHHRGPGDGDLGAIGVMFQPTILRKQCVAVAPKGDWEGGVAGGPGGKNFF